VAEVMRVLDDIVRQGKVLYVGISAVGPMAYTAGFRFAITRCETRKVTSSDAGRIVQKDLDIAEYTDPLHNPMIPHVIVLEPGLVIYRIYNGYWFLGRPTLEDLRQDLRAVTKKCRPDWDITTPELKAAWQQGRKELFYPYGKTYVQTLGEQD